MNTGSGDHNSRQFAAACGLFCPECSAINSAYDLTCRRCGNEPGSPFAERHKDWVSKVLGEMAGK